MENANNDFNKMDLIYQILVNYINNMLPQYYSSKYDVIIYHIFY